eukprot:TRINITY_DN472_c0_g1_i1.p1 TRINITY_DN472_c0_g1~~TRINITY_DN472_c0_g1_i1.p1  ORF type:complete len:1426 (-),score=359.75 TRINITY_DN472_c0_g1_i1:2688-6965(-)
MPPKPRQVFRWFSDPKDGFVLAENHPNDPKKWIVKQKGTPIEVTGESWEANPPDQDGVKDNTMLMRLHEPGVLHNIKVRFMRDEVYTYTGYILIAMNPYKPLSIYNDNYIQMYRGKAIGVLDPHVYAVADRAYRKMFTELKSQSILVSGESGAGKTETSKIVMKFLVKVGGRSDRGGEIEDRILESNPIMEAFGNAKTIRNNNSSRFGKYMQMHFNKSFQVSGASIVTYLLEKSRIVKQSKNERNYHIFYQLCAGATEEEKAKYYLKPAAEFGYLNGGNACVINGVNDKAEFQLVRQALSSINISEEQQQDIWGIIAGVLYLGNIQFKEGRGENSFIESREELRRAAELLRLEESQLEFVLTHRRIVTKAQTFDRPLNALQARDLCDVLAKSIYSNLFDWIVSVINKSLTSSEDAVSHIGILDIFGFESFDVNSFEQLCINYTNESLQQYFNSCIFVQELDLYKREGIKAPEIEYQDNQDCISLIDEVYQRDKTPGILSMLDEEMKLPDKKDASFTEKVFRTHGKHSKLDKPPRKYTQSEAFVIKHYAGDVCYNTAGFLEKNTNTVHPDHESLINSTNSPILKALFATDGSGAPSPTLGLSRPSTVASGFVKSLKQLVEDLQETESHFIRCIKPTTKQLPGVFEGDIILNQLRCNGMMAALQLMHAGYPTRSPYDDLHKRFKSMLPESLLKLKTKDFCEALLMTLNIDRKDFALGVSRVFFRSGKLAFLDELRSSGQVQSADVVAKIVKWIARKNFRLAIWTTIASIKLYKKAILIRNLNGMRMLARIAFRIQRFLMPKLKRARRKRKAAITIERVFRGFQARKRYGPILAKKRVERMLRGEEEKRRETEKLLKSLQEEKKRKEDEERRIREENERKLNEQIERARKDAENKAAMEAERVLKEKERQMQEKAAEAQQAKADFEKKISELDKHNHDNEKKIKQLQDENATLTKSNQRLTKEVESSQSRLRSLEHSSNEKLAQSERDFEQVKSQFELQIQEYQSQLSAAQEKYDQMEESYVSQIRVLKSQVANLQLQNTDQSSEINNLKKLLSQTTEESVADSVEKSKELSTLKAANAELQANAEKLTAALAREKSENTTTVRELQKRLSEKDEEISQASSQHAVLTKKVHSAQAQLEEMEESHKQEVSKLKKEILQLNNDKQHKEDEARLHEAKLKTKHEEAIEELESKVRELESAKAARESQRQARAPSATTQANPEALAQMESLKKELKQAKDAAAKAALKHKKEIEEKEAEILELQDRINRSRREVDNYAQERDQWKKKGKEAEAKYRDYQDEVESTFQEHAKAIAEAERKIALEKEKVTKGKEEVDRLTQDVANLNAKLIDVTSKVKEVKVGAEKGQQKKIEELQGKLQKLEGEEKKKEVEKQRVFAALKSLSPAMALPPHLRDLRGGLSGVKDFDSSNVGF